MCNRCNENPCTEVRPCGDCQVRDLGTQCIIYTGPDLTCINKLSGTPLNEVIEATVAQACEGNSGGTTTLINVGSGYPVYAGDDNTGAKKIKTFSSSDSIDFSATSTNITASVNLKWLSMQGIGAVYPENIIEFTGTNPNTTGTIFTPNIPQDDDALYWSSANNRNWKWDPATTAYIIAQDNPNSTPFYLAGTTTDAGGNKEADITRTGSLGIGKDPVYALDVEGAIGQTNVTSAIIKAGSDGKLIAALAGTDYLTPTGSAALLTGFPTLNQNTTGNAATVTTIPNLVGDVTSVGNTTTLGTTTVTAGTYTSPTITINGQGRITAAVNGGGSKALKDFYTQSQNIDATNTTIYSYAIPANTLISNGDKIIQEYAGVFADKVVTKVITLSVGGSSYAFTTNVSGKVDIKSTLIRSGSNTAVITIQMLVDGSLPLVLSGSFTVSNWNLLQNNVLQVQGSSTGDSVFYLGTIQYIPAAL